jgi:predicted lipoprotein with Yx(FWY)xxD motif
MGMLGIEGGDKADRYVERRDPRGLIAIVVLAVALFLALPGAAGAAVLYPPIAGTAKETASGFELTGTVYNYGGASADTTYHFEYGTSTEYGSSVPVPDADAGSGLATPVSQQITGLQPNTTYHYRLVSTNSVEGSGVSADRTLSTAEASATPPAGGGTMEPAPVTGPGAYPSPGEATGPTAPAAGGKGPKTVVKEVKSGGHSLLATKGGRTLYSLSVETHGKFVCTATSGCTSIWHPLIVAAGVVPKGPVKLGTVKRPEGTVQVTYRGRPLYTFGGDKKAGQTKGDGIHDVGTWHAATAPSNP